MMSLPEYYAMMNTGEGTWCYTITEARQWAARFEMRAMTCRIYKRCKSTYAFGEKPDTSMIYGYCVAIHKRRYEDRDLWIKRPVDDPVIYPLGDEAQKSLETFRAPLRPTRLDAPTKPFHPTGWVWTTPGDLIG